jgi:23S rRNA (cytosine1962-C5)-methyltransferase
VNSPTPFYFEDDLLFVNKPYGISTHAVDKNKPGLAEILEKELSIEKIYVVHRLDKTTSGAMIFATTPQAAATVFTQFKEHLARKKYFFLTRSLCSTDEFWVTSNIRPSGKNFVSDGTQISTEEPDPVSESLALTHFQRVKGNAYCQLWQAHPRTGKPHQVRIHAAQAGIPILGDSQYGGATYPQICLHSAGLKLLQHHWECQSPPFFERLGLVRDTQLCSWLRAIDNRQRVLGFLQKPKQAFRLMHFEDPDLAVDLYGDCVWFYWYRQAPPNTQDLERCEFLASFLGRKKYTVQQMLNRGRSPQDATSWGSLPASSRWLVEENEMFFWISNQFGQSPGLFLDQRKNRFWVRASAKNKKVLNLFAYTCGFSVAAALGGAQKVESVDVSANFLEWGKTNFSANLLPLSQHHFVKMDCRDFLNFARKKNYEYDLIICDPPSFGRSSFGVFRLEKDFLHLLKDCWSLLISGGQLLFCYNLETLAPEVVLSKIRDSLSPKRISLREPDWDYRLGDSSKGMRSFLIEK